VTSDLPVFRRPLRPLAVAVPAGLAVAALGGAWILAEFTRRPWFDLAYHAPLAFVATGAAVDAWMRRTTRPVRGSAWAAAVAAAITVGRVLEDWPFSGHALLGVLVALRGAHGFWRAAGLAVAVQAWVTKAAVGEEPATALYGAALGGVMAALAAGIDRARRRPTAPS